MTHLAEIANRMSMVVDAKRQFDPRVIASLMVTIDTSLKLLGYPQPGFSHGDGI
jgi:hypothetical protein